MILNIFLKPLYIFVEINLVMIFLYTYLIGWPSDFEQQLSFFSTLSTILGIIGIAFNAFYTAKRVEALEKSANAAYKNIELTEKTQITDRFYKAIEQLNSENNVIRLGAIYTLVEIARGNDFFYHLTKSILTTFIHQNSLTYETKLSESLDTYKTSLEVQQAFKALIKLQSEYQLDNDPLIFSNIHLFKIDLSKATLSNLKFIKVNLIYTSFSQSVVNKTEFTNVNFFGSDFFLSKLKDVIFCQCDLSATSSLNPNDMDDVCADLTTFPENFNTSKIIPYIF